MVLLEGVAGAHIDVPPARVNSEKMPSFNVACRLTAFNPAISKDLVPCFSTNFGEGSTFGSNKALHL